MQYLKYYIRLVKYQKSEKSNDWLPRNAKNAYFLHLFAILGQFFFKIKRDVEFFEIWFTRLGD